MPKYVLCLGNKGWDQFLTTTKNYAYWYFWLISVCTLSWWPGVSSRPGVEAVCEGGSVMYRPHNEPQQELHTRLPVSSQHCPTGGWDGSTQTAIMLSLCSYSCLSVFPGWCMCPRVRLSLWCGWGTIFTGTHCSHRVQQLVSRTEQWTTSSAVFN